ncbi:MobA/MobL family protein [Megasphaera massiliensis]|uniref:MobA/MobL family protein n=1 Tax=Megasphaera massiliensis TaxID=1232428 RepID=UPI001E4FD97C|nr:MobA/MobL family protein [Megasphaera massiliensis]
MPDWANTAGQFWDAAEKGRQSNGRAYREIRMGLQEELSLEENIALVEEFLKESGIGKNHAFSYAIHDKEAAYDSDHRNIHCHLMFSEKTIEKDRPLGPDMYFKHYYLNEQGDPCAGYRADRYYQSRQGNVQMRKQWADIVNRKFQELGIDQEVSEKTLEAQRQDLLAQGRFEEAEQFDRIPAPHLGDAYKNPKTVERIKEKVREIDEQTEYPGCSADQAAETDNNDDVVEQKIVCFATDKVLRRVTKEIQQARQRLRQEDIQRLEARIAAEQDDAEAEALANKPIVVTIRDVYEELEYRAEEEAKKRTQMLVFYKDIKKQIIPDRFLRNAAIERLIGSDYRNTKKRLNRIQEELVPMEQKYIELKDIPYAEKKEFYLSYSDKLRQKQALEQKIKAYHEELNKREDEIQTIMDELKAENESHKERLKNLYGKINKSERMEKIYSEKAMEIKNNVSDFDKILYSRKMPRLVMRHCSLDGETPLTNYQIIPYQGKAFVILSDVPTEPWERQKKTALLLGDTVEKGKANVYVVTMYSEGKDISGVSKTTEQVRLYANAKTAMELQTGKGNHYSPQIQNVQQRRKSEIVGKIEEFLRAATENTNGRYHAWWDDEEPRKKKDKLKQVEEDLYRGWNM